MERDFTVEHAQEVHSSLKRGSCSPSKAARMTNAFERLNGDFSSGAMLACSICRLRQRHGDGGVQDGHNRFVIDNPVAPGHRLGLCDYHLAQHLLLALHERGG